MNSHDLFLRSRKVQESKTIKRGEQERLRQLFLHNLMLRTLSKPTKGRHQTIEFARRIIQLLLLAYKRPIKSSTIKGLLNRCYRKRIEIMKLRAVLVAAKMPEDNFILFCYWYLNRFPNKLYKIFAWIISEAYIDMRKFEASDNGFWKKIYEFVNLTERGKRLIRIVKVKRNNDLTYEWLKNY